MLPKIKLKEMSSKQNQKQEKSKYRANSPHLTSKPFYTYIGLSCIPNKREIFRNVGVKRIQVQFNKRIQHKNYNQEVLEKLCKNYTYKFLKNPYLEQEHKLRNQNYQISALYYFIIDLMQERRRVFTPEARGEQQREQINNQIIFSSPFYKKRKIIVPKYKNFSKIISKEEIERYSSDIWRDAHTPHIPPII